MHRRCVVTGGAGFIGSHLVAELLALRCDVVVIDNLVSGREENLAAAADDARRRVVSKGSPASIGSLSFVKGDICDGAALRSVMTGASVVFHQAALGSVKRSIENPFETNRVNVEGSLQVLLAARACGVQRVVYASSSSVYGDSTASPKRECDTGSVLSPYAASKAFCEVYSRLFHQLYGLESIGLRYFNVFGPRQNPQGDYAAVIPRWISARLRGEPCEIYGDGLTSRDFCYVANVVDANLCAATAPMECSGKAYNVALGDETTLNELYALIDAAVGGPSQGSPPLYREFRIGDVRRSRADISLARSELGYSPSIRIKQGLEKTVASYRTEAEAPVR